MGAPAARASPRRSQSRRLLMASSLTTSSDSVHAPAVGQPAERQQLLDQQQPFGRLAGRWRPVAEVVEIRPRDPRSDPIAVPPGYHRPNPDPWSTRYLVHPPRGRARTGARSGARSPWRRRLRPHSHRSRSEPAEGAPSRFAPDRAERSTDVEREWVGPREPGGPGGPGLSRGSVWEDPESLVTEGLAIESFLTKVSDGA